MSKLVSAIVIGLVVFACQPSSKASGDFVRLTTDTLSVLPSFPDSSEVIYENRDFLHKWHGNKNLKPANLSTYFSKPDSHILSVSRKTNWLPNHDKITMNWYAVPEIKLLKTNQSAFNDLSESNCETHHVLSDAVPLPDFSPEIELAFKREFDRISNRKLKSAFSVYLVESVSYGSDKLFALERPPTLYDVINPESSWNFDNYLTKKSLVYFFNQLKEDPVTVYQNILRISENGSEIPDHWNSLWSSLKSIGVNREKQPDVFLKGFNFAHEGYRGNNGYSSEMAKKSLNQMSGLNANTIALIPYGFIASADESTPIYWANRGGSENDESIIYAGNNAKKMGYYVMLKPQLWLRFGKWCGDLNMSTETDWQELENNYRNWILHYAFLAEENNFDALCIGVELKEFTRNRPDFFRQLIKDVRQIYNGAVTYNANWYDEFERIPFWDETDFIGVSSYFPLSQDSVWNAEEINKSLVAIESQFEKVSNTFDKQIVLTEIGFADNHIPWRNPHDERVSSVYDSAAQSLGFGAVFENWSNKPWLGGVLIWKWSTNTEHHYRERINFFPNAKSKSVIKRWFTVW